MKISAGCIVVKVFEGRPHILLVHAAGNWKNKRFGFPKGEVEPGEDPKEAAIREVKEETGIKPKIIEYIGSVKTYNKKVIAFLAEVESGKIDDKKRTIEYDKKEVDVSKFYPVEKAIEMVYEYQKPLFEKALKLIRRHF